MSSTTPTTQFYYDPQQREFTAFISDLGPGFRFRQIYPDSIDEGMTLVGRTGQEVDFAVNRTKHDSHGDIQLWELVPTRSAIKHCPRLAGVKVIIFND